MIALLQRVLRASVEIGVNTVGKTDRGLLILLGAAEGDTESDALLLAEKISKLRIFSDENGKMNLSVNDIGGGALIVSQFTLLADYSHGNRPDFFGAAKPEEAKRLYEYFVGQMKLKIKTGKVETGIFGADMQVSLINDGPVTIITDSEKLKKGNK